MKASIFSSFSRMRVVALSVAAACMVFVACGQREKPTVVGPQTLSLPEGVDPPDMNEVIFPGQKEGEAPNYPDSAHLKQCGTGFPECTGGTSCLGLRGASACFFQCNPDNGEGEVQNPDCIKPENCIRLSNGGGVCIFFPGQLYGSGSYEALVRHKQGERCLLRYGGCLEGHICVDTKNDGSIGTCEESCIPKTIPDSKNQPKCGDSKKTCRALASGVGACLP